MGNSCNCPSPPGGSVNCRSDQLAICRVKDGQVHSYCVDITPSTRFGIGHFQLDDGRIQDGRVAAFAAILEIEPQGLLSNPYGVSDGIFSTYQKDQILRSGEAAFQDGTRVTFRLPDAIAFERRGGSMDPRKVIVGIAPTLWSNDDFVSIDNDIAFEQCVSEMAMAGFEGCSIGHKYPAEPAVLKAALELRGLRVSESWVSTYFTNYAMRARTIATFQRQMEFLTQMGATDIAVAEFGGAVNPLPVALFANRPILTDAQWKALAEGLNQLGKMASGSGMRLCYHPHVGTGVMTGEEIDRLMEMTDPTLVHLLLDTGHLAFAGTDPLEVTQKHGKRIKHIHLKNVRPAIVNIAKEQNYSFEDSLEAGVFTVAGDPGGGIDFPPIFQALAAANFEGWLVIEAEQDPKKDNPLSYAKMASNFVRKELGY
jgi:inosose dehydratase